MSSHTSFKFASERLELTVNAIACIAKGEPLDSSFASLSVMQFDEERHGGLLYRSLDQIAAISDEPIEWSHGRGLSGLVRGPADTFPHVWSSAHQAALELSRIALRYFFWPLEVTHASGKLSEFQHLAVEQLALFRKLLSARRRKAMAMSMQEVAQWQERIRRERAKLLASNQTDKPDAHERQTVCWSEAKTPDVWRSELKLAETTMRNHIKQGMLVVDKISTKLWRFRLDTLERYLGK